MRNSFIINNDTYKHYFYTEEDIKKALNKFKYKQ